MLLQQKLYFLAKTLCIRVVNWPTSLGPNPARKLIWGPNHARKKNESSIRSEKFSNVAKLFWLCFCATKTKSTSQARIISLKFLSTLGPNPTRTPAKKPGPTYNPALYYMWLYNANFVQVHKCRKRSNAGQFGKQFSTTMIYMGYC